MKKIESINRRGFLEQSAKISAAGLVLSRLPARTKRLVSILSLIHI